MRSLVRAHSYGVSPGRPQAWGWEGWKAQGSRAMVPAGLSWTPTLPNMGGPLGSWPGSSGTTAGSQGDGPKWKSRDLTRKFSVAIWRLWSPTRLKEKGTLSSPGTWSGDSCRDFGMASLPLAGAGGHTQRWPKHFPSTVSGLWSSLGYAWCVRCNEA